MLPFAPLVAFQAQSPADLVVVNAKIWTDGHLRKEDCIAVKAGKVVYLGSITGLKLSKKTVIVDAKRRVVIPGLIDSHTHLMEGGTGLIDQLDLRGATTKEDFIRRIRDFSAKLPAGKWVIGHSWSAESWPGQPQPRKEWIDEATGGRPAVLERMDGHSVLVNSAALKLANIDKNGPANPAGGVIDRDSDGEPTGILRERASGLVNPPAPSAEDTYRGFKAAVKNANSFGVTASSDIASPLRIAFYRRYFAEKNPTFRIGFYSRTDSWPLAFQALAQAKPIAGWFQPNGVKAYMDGSLGSRTAYMHEPFTKPLPQQPADWRGLPMPGAVDGTYATRFQEAASRGLQVIVHAIGDQANHDVLDLFSQVPNVQSRRFRIEHVQHLLPSDYESFAKFGVIPSMQPYHKADDGRYCEDVIGTVRSRSSYVFNSLLGHQAKLAFGSDWPVVTINPWEGIKTAVTGQILTGKIWMPEQNISLDEALDSYTRRGAYAMKMESVIGSLTAGHRADFVILNLDAFKQGIDLAKVRPISLYVEGRKVY